MARRTVRTKEQVSADIAAVLARALGRLTLAEAEGRLTPVEARVVAELRADMAAEDAAQQRQAA